MMHARASYWEKRQLGRSGLEVSRIGLGSSYGLDERDVERAFERGINYLYWGSARRPGFGRAIRRLAARHRSEMVVVVQSYARLGLALRPSLELALRRLHLDHADVLLLGWWNQPPPERIVDAAMQLREAGKCRTILISCHHRPTFAALAADPCYGGIMVRYNAAHRGAEREVFPAIAASASPPGVVAYTATRWGALLDRALVPAEERLPRASDCYRFALAAPAVDLVLSGPRDGAELDEAMAALDRGPMEEEELAWMRRVGDAVHARAGTPSAVRNPSLLLDRVASRLYRPLSGGGSSERSS
jgi:aryl-alcohol dehydrogenase-like predicted oxidoreductase